MYYIVKQFGYGVNLYAADTSDDIKDIPLRSCNMGSYVRVIDTGAEYMLNSKGEWCKQTTSSGTGSGSSAELEKELAQLKEKHEALTQEVEELRKLTITTDMWNALGSEVEGDGTMRISPQMFTLQEDGTLTLGGVEV